MPLLALAAVGAGLVTTVLLVRNPEDASASTPLAQRLDDIAALLGLGIDQASVTGYRYALDSDILDALDLPHARSFLGFDVTAARRRIEQLPWIESAEIARQLPGSVAVTVTERKPYALWRDGDRSFFVDVTGRVLTVVRPDDAPALPRIAGAGAPAEAAALFTTLARYPTVRDRLVEAERVGGRRWALKLAGNVTVELPADREALVLESLEAGDALTRLIAGQDRVVDMRADGRVAVRPVDASTRHPGGR